MSVSFLIAGEELINQKGEMEGKTLCLCLAHFCSDCNLLILLVFPTVQVRDIYDYGDYLILVTTDRQSAFDRVLASIPFKGQVFFTECEANHCWEFVAYG